MKNQFVVVLFLIFTSCSCIEPGAGTIPPELQIFLKKAITDPKKLYNLREYFSEYLHPKYFNVRIFDTNNISKFIRVLEDKVNNNCAYKYFDISSGLNDPYIPSNYQNEYINTMELNNIFSTRMSKLYCYVLEFVWVRIDSKYYLYDIRSTSGNCHDNYY